MRYILPFIFILGCSNEQEHVDNYEEIDSGSTSENNMCEHKEHVVEESVHVGNAPRTTKLDVLLSGAKLTSCYRMTVVHDAEQDTVCYIVISQCSSSVPSISCVKF